MTPPSILTHCLLLALAGGIGTLGRVGLTLLVSRLCGADYPWGTLAANLLGSCAFGAIVGAVRSRGGWANGLETLLMVGVLGGFTTFSSYAFQTLELLEAGRPLAAVGYALGTNLVALAAVFIGLRLAS
ncbi:MAG: CrcB family protein [Planctomycetota bacterium]